MKKSREDYIAETFTALCVAIVSTGGQPDYRPAMTIACEMADKLEQHIVAPWEI